MTVAGKVGLGASALVLALAVSGAWGMAEAGSQENFIAADRNRDSALTRSEFRRFIDLEAAQGTGFAPTIKEQNMYDEAFDMVDTNGDGRFTVDETRSTPGGAAASIR